MHKLIESVDGIASFGRMEVEVRELAFERSLVLAQQMDEFVG